MFAYVKFALDQHKETMPSEYIKDFKHDRMYKVGEELRVFWSGNGEGPKDIIRKQKVINDIDEYKGNNPPPGYYKADLLLFEETKEELLDKIDQKRVRQPSNKIKEVVNSSSAAKSSSSAAKETTKNKKPKTENNEKLTAKTQKENIANLLRKKKRSRSPSLSGDDDDEEVAPVKKLHDEIATLKSKLKDLGKKNAKLAAKNDLYEEELRNAKEEIIMLKVELKVKTVTPRTPSKRNGIPPSRRSPRNQSKNLHLTPSTSKKALFSEQNGGSSGIPISVARPSLPKDAKIARTAELDDKAITSIEETVDAEDEASSSSAETADPGDKARARTPETADSGDNQDDFSSEPSELSDNNSNITVENVDSNNTQEKFSISEDMYAAVLESTTAKEPGDSKFVKNAAAAIFGIEVLMRSSVTGQRNRADKNSVAKDSVCKDKLEYLTELFKRRGREEGFDVASDAFKKRASLIGKYIKSKITSLNDNRSRKKKNQENK